jgi:hypothetical protein
MISAKSPRPLVAGFDNKGRNGTAQVDLYEDRVEFIRGELAVIPFNQLKRVILSRPALRSNQYSCDLITFQGKRFSFGFYYGLEKHPVQIANDYREFVILFHAVLAERRMPIQFRRSRMMLVVVGVMAFNFSLLFAITEWIRINPMQWVISWSLFNFFSATVSVFFLSLPRYSPLQIPSTYLPPKGNK